MLILSRRAGEAIVVDEKTTLTVLSIKGRQVRIGIDAPDDVSVHREEIHKKIKAGEGNPFNAGGGNTANPPQAASQDAKDQNSAKEDAALVSSSQSPPSDCAPKD